MEQKTFSTRSNAKRAAEKAIRDGSAPSIDYGIKPCAKHRYRFEVAWLTKGGTQEVPTTEQVSAEIAMATTEADKPASEHDSDPFVRIEAREQIAALGTTPEKYGFEAPPVAEVLATAEEKADKEIAEAPADTPANASHGDQNMADRFPPGTRVIVDEGKRKRRSGTVHYRVDATSCRVKFDGPHPSALCRYSQLSLDDGSEALPSTVKTERRARAAPSGDRKPSKNTEMDAAAARGEMPVKPIMTSKTNTAQYQPRFDKLEAMATAGDWDGVHAYEPKGINSYAKMVKQYRERLLAAHAAQQPAKTEAA